jgi:hypothetical protein
MGAVSSVRIIMALVKHQSLRPLPVIGLFSGDRMIFISG